MHDTHLYMRKEPSRVQNVYFELPHVVYSIVARNKKDYFSFTPMTHVTYPRGAVCISWPLLMLHPSISAPDVFNNERNSPDVLVRSEDT